MVRDEHGRAALLLTLLGILLAACTTQPARTGLDADGLPLGPVTYKEVSAHPEATLYYPGATVLSLRGSDERTYMITNRSAAFAGAVLSTTDSADQVYAWYQHWLTAHGWSACEVVRTLDQISVQGYCRGHREHFTIAVDNPQFLRPSPGQASTAAVTTFETAYLIAPAGQATPTPTAASASAT